MENIIANRLFDKAFEGERINCTSAIKDKPLEKDAKNIFKGEKIIDYRCYFSKTGQTIYYIVETKTHYICFKENLQTKKQLAYQMDKGELELL